jgi:hypothetical protein
MNRSYICDCWLIKHIFYNCRHAFFYSRTKLHMSSFVNKTSLVHNLFLIYLSISACFGRIWAHHQEKQLCFCETRYLWFCVDDCLVCGSICFCTPDSDPHRITSTKCRKNTVVAPDDGPIVAQNMQRLINILRVNCAASLFYLQDYTQMHGQENIKIKQV